MTIYHDKASQFNLDSYENIFLLYYSGLIVYTSRIVYNREVAEDIVHDVFEALWEKRNDIQLQTIKPYLFSAVRNRALNYLKQLKVRSHFHEQVLAKGDIIGILTWESYVESELNDYIDEIIASLPPRTKEVIIKNRIEGRKAQEIAFELGISRRTVEKHIEVALKILREKLSDYKNLILLLLS